MPETSPIAKVRGTEEYGPEVVKHGSGYDDAYQHGTVGLELLEQNLPGGVRGPRRRGSFRECAWRAGRADRQHEGEEDQSRIKILAPYRNCGTRLLYAETSGGELISRNVGISLLFAVTVAVVAIGLSLPRIPQPQSYHVFADQRRFLGIPNFGNVASNLPFAAIGLWGLVFLRTASRERDPKHFRDGREAWPYGIVFTGLLLTAFGSGYYHLQPSNPTLLWDRLPMVLVFMSVVAAVIGERLSLRAGLWLLPVLLFIGISSVYQWHVSELQGAGDLRFYGAVQAYSVLFLLVAVLLRPSYTRGRDLAIVAGFYILAKVLEALDKPIFELGHIVSGHTLKHLAAAAAGYWLLRMLQLRRPLPDRGAGSSDE